MEAGVLWEKQKQSGNSLQLYLYGHGCMEEKDRMQGRSGEMQLELVIAGF